LKNQKKSLDSASRNTTRKGRVEGRGTVPRTRVPRVTPPIPQKVASQRIDVIETAPASSGKTKLLKYLHGGRLSRGESLVAKCCECMGYYVDGRESCGIVTCPLYAYMPYQKRSGGSGG
jgi:hypothetical protein